MTTIDRVNGTCGYAQLITDPGSNEAYVELRPKDPRFDLEDLEPVKIAGSHDGLSGFVKANPVEVAVHALGKNFGVEPDFVKFASVLNETAAIRNLPPLEMLKMRKLMRQSMVDYDGQDELRIKVLVHDMNAMGISGDDISNAISHAQTVSNRPSDFARDFCLQFVAPMQDEVDRQLKLTLETGQVPDPMEKLSF